MTKLLPLASVWRDVAWASFAAPKPPDIIASTFKGSEEATPSREIGTNDILNSDDDKTLPDSNFQR